MASSLYLPTVPQLESARLEVEEYIETHRFQPRCPIQDYEREDMFAMMAGITERLQWLGSFGLRLTVSAESVYYAASGVPFCGKVDVLEDSVATGEYQGVSVTVHSGEGGQEQLNLMLSIHGDVTFRGRSLHGSIGVPVDGQASIGVGSIEAMN